MKRLLPVNFVSLLVVAALLSACTPQVEPAAAQPSLDSVPESADASASASVSEQDPTAPQPPGLSEAVASLGARLAPRLVVGEKVGNLAFSPVGIHIVLSVLASGAGESSRARLAALLGLSLDETFEAHYREKLEELKKIAGVELHVRLDCDQRLAPKAEWIASLSSDFQAQFERQDFLNDARGSTARIDHWFREQTRGRIPNLYGTDVLPKLSTLVASSVVTFRMDWAQRFSLLETAVRPFVLQGGQSVSVPMMRAEKLPMMVARIGDVPAEPSVGIGVSGPLWVALPFSGEDTFLLLGLPATTEGLPAIEQQLSDPGVGTILNQMDSGDHEVLLPKIDWLTPTFSLTNQIQKLEGGEELAHLDLTRAGLSGSFPLSSLMQRVAVRWDEQGADLAAATSAAGVGIGLATAQPIAFDHPFVFAVVERATGMILFQGRVADPRTYR